MSAPSVPAPNARGSTRDLLRRIYANRTVYLFLAPSFLLMLMFSYYPFLSAIQHSFTRWTVGGVSHFVGLKNFIELAGDEVFLTALANLLKLSAFAIVVNTTAPLFAAELIFNLKSARLQYFSRAMLVFPMVVPFIVMVLVWGFIYDAEVGIINQFLSLIGLESLRHAWLGDARFALLAMMFIGFPWVGGFSLLIYLSGLQAISDEILDSALIDGVNVFRRFWYIDLPMVLGQVKLILILSVINSLQSFGVQLILTEGGPGFATLVPGLYMYNMGFWYARMGYATTIGFVLFILIFGLTYLNFKGIKVETEYVARR